MSARAAIPATANSYFRFDRAAGSIDALDGLRGLAVLLVLLRHAAFPVAEQAGRPVWTVGGYDLAIPLVNGWIGVDLFFVLSGFLIASHLLRSFEGRNSFSWKRYLAQRFLRIVPTYWFVLALAAAGAIPLFAVGPQSLGIRTAYHLLLLQDYLPPNIVVAFWSLGVEEKFYLLAPAIVAAALWPRRFGHRILVLGLFVAAPVLSRCLQAAQMGGGIEYTEFLPVFRYPFHHCLDTLAIGMITALLYRRLQDGSIRHDPRLAGWLAWGGMAATGWILCGGELLGVIGRWDETLQPTVIAAAFGAMVLGAALGGGPQRFLSSDGMLVAARLSYPLYLIHMTLIPLCSRLAGAAPADGAAALLRFLPVYAAVSIAAAAAIHFAVEKPFLILKDRLRRRETDAMSPGNGRAAAAALETPAAIR